jgi:hypothetical protein
MKEKSIPVLWRKRHKRFSRPSLSFRYYLFRVTALLVTVTGHGLYPCMAEPHVVTALRAKRAEISGHVHDLERKLARHRASLAAIDATS